MVYKKSKVVIEGLTEESSVKIDIENVDIVMVKDCDINTAKASINIDGDTTRLEAATRVLHNDGTSPTVFIGKLTFKEVIFHIPVIHGQKFKKVYINCATGDQITGQEAHIIDGEGTIELCVVVKRANGNIERIIAEWE